MAAAVRRFDAVVFDLFGTLVFEFPRAEWDAALSTVAATLEADGEAFRSAWDATTIERQTGAMGDIEEILRTVAARAGAWPSDAQVAEALEVRRDLYRRWFLPRPGAEDIVRLLRSDGYPLALVSMCAPDAPAMWRASVFAGTMDVEVFSSETGLRKPDPRIYLAASEGLGVDATRCVYVGDGSYGELTGAAEVGMHAVLISDPTEEDQRMLRPESEASAWDGPTIAELSQINALLQV